MIATISLAAATVAIAASGGDGSVSGVVTADGQPVPGARVTVYVPSLADFFETRTAADGSYGFAAVPVGPKLMATSTSTTW